MIEPLRLVMGTAGTVYLLVQRRLVRYLGQRQPIITELLG